MYQYSVRLEDDVKDELEFLCKLFNVSKNQLFNSLIRSTYNEYAEDPKIKEFMSNFQELQGVLSKFSDK